MEGNQDRRTFLKAGLTLGSGLAIGGIATADERENPQEMSILDVIKKRRSVRKFKSTPVPKEHLTQILDAARFAPSPRNRQAWKFLVVQDRNTLNQIKEECIKQSGERSRNYFEDYLSAPVYITVLVDTKTRNPVNDVTAGALAVQNMMLMARALGYGTVFCANSIPEGITKKVLNIPDHYQRVCITPVGIPDEWPKTPDKKSLEEVVVYEKM